MQEDINHVQMSGVISKFKSAFSPNGKRLITFSLETRRKWRGKDGQIKVWADRLNVNWEPVDEDVYVNDGDYVLVHGRLGTNSKEYNGERKFFTNIIAENVIQCNPPREDNPQYKSGRYQNEEMNF